MALTIDDGDKRRASALETKQKAALSTGVTGFATAIMTPNQYNGEGAGAGITENFNKASAAAVFSTLRAIPFRLLVCTATTLPPAEDHTGAVVFVSNGSAGAACLAFSDGTTWKCANSLADVSP